MKTSAQSHQKTLCITNVQLSKRSNSTFSFAIQGRKDPSDTVSLVIDYGDNTCNTVKTGNCMDKFYYYGTRTYDQPGYYTVVITALSPNHGQTDTVGTTLYQNSLCAKPATKSAHSIMTMSFLRRFLGWEWIRS